MNGVIFATATRRLNVGEHALKRMLNCAQRSPSDLESGGVLLGRHMLDGATFVIDEVTRPMVGDEQTRSSFLRGCDEHQKAIEEAWACSGGFVGYLGEWHTQAEPDPTPHEASINDWRGRLASAIEQGVHSALFFVVVGTEQVRVWCGDPVAKKIEHMEVVLAH